jgi:hypothetical protein
MYNIDAYVGNPNKKSAQIKQLPLKRDWIHSTTYNCFPVGFANTFGYGVYFDEDISFIWDGDVANPAKAVLGKDYVWEGRGEGTVSFVTNLVFKSDPDVSLITLPVPNHFIQGASVITTILSTSFFTSEFSIVLKIDENFAGKEITIPAGTPVACILPISIAQFNNSTINIKPGPFPFERTHDRDDYIKAIKDFMAKGINPRFYKKGIDEKGNKIGSHEVDKFVLNVLDKRTE